MARAVNIDPRDIIGSAGACLQKKGLAATTLKDVAAHAGVTQGTVYYHFKTKEELMAAVVDQAISENLEAMEAVWEIGGDVKTIIGSVLDITRDTYGRDENFKLLFFNIVALALHNERAAEVFSRSADKVVSVIERRSRQIAEEHGQKFIPPDHMSRIIVAVVIGLALQSIFQKEMDIDGVYESFKIMMKQQAGLEPLPGEVEEK